MISIKMGVESGNCIFKDENPKPASMAAIPEKRTTRGHMK